MRRLHLIACAVAALAIAGFASTSRAALVGYWNFNTDTATTGTGGITDLAGGDHNATLVGGSFSSDVPAALAGGTSRSLDLTGGDYYAIVDSFLGGASENDLDGGAAMTISVWVKGWPDNDWEPFVSKRGETDGWQIRKRSNTNFGVFTTRGVGNDDAPLTTTNLNDSSWKHVLGVYDGVEKRIYVNGVLEASADANGAISNTNAFVVFGARDNSTNSGPHTPNVSNFSRIQLDDVAFFNEVLAPNQITALAAGVAADALPAAPPKINWNFRFDLQGWSLENGFDSHQSGNGGGVVAYNGVSYNSDAAHPNFLIRSPTFHFDGGTIDGVNALMVELAGGPGDQSSNIGNYNSPADVLSFNSGSSASNGVKALAFLDPDSGQYVAFVLKSGNGGIPTYNFTPSDLSTLGLQIGKTYQLDFFDTDEGSWGWVQLNQIMIAGALGDLPVPEPASMALLGLAGLALAKRRRRAA